jgi:hypothetical protein
MRAGGRVAEDKPYIADIIEALREGRVTSAAVAAEWLELRINEHVRAARSVRAHVTQQQRSRLHSAVDDALSGGAQDEFARLFPPSRPLGPPLGAEEYHSGPPVYPGEDQGKRARRVTTWDGYTHAGAPAEEELDDADYLRVFPEAYRRGTWPGGGDE